MVWSCSQLPKPGTRGRQWSLRPKALAIHGRRPPDFREDQLTSLRPVKRQKIAKASTLYGRNTVVARVATSSQFSCKLHLRCIFERTQDCLASPQSCHSLHTSTRISMPKAPSSSKFVTSSSSRKAADARPGSPKAAPVCSLICNLVRQLGKRR